MKKRKKAFISGITGLLGSYLAKELLSKGYKVIALARSSKGKSAKQRAFEILKFVYGKRWNQEHINLSLEIIDGDIVNPGLGISDTHLYRYLSLETDIIIHCAALTELRAPWQEIRKVNIDGTRNILEFAMFARKIGKLKKFNHISTIYVAGTTKKKFTENDLVFGQKFNNAYEKSKFEAEVLVNKYMRKGLKTAIFRPSMIIGDSESGKTNNFRLFYQPLHYFVNEIFEKYPGDLSSTQNLINVDVAASSIAMLVESEESPVYHIISPKNIALRFLMKSASAYFNFRMPKFIPAKRFNFDLLSPAQKALAQPFLPYFNYKVNYVSTLTKNILEKYNFNFPSVDKNNLNRIFKYCTVSGFIKPNSYKPKGR